MNTYSDYAGGSLRNPPGACFDGTTPQDLFVRRLFHPLFHVYCAQTGSRRSGHRGRRDSLKPWHDGIHQAGTKGPRDELAGTGHGSPEAKAAQSSSSSAGPVSRKQRSRTIHTRVWLSRQIRWGTQEGSCLHGRKGAVLLTLGVILLDLDDPLRSIFSPSRESSRVSNAFLPLIQASRNTGQETSASTRRDRKRTCPPFPLPQPHPSLPPRRKQTEHVAETKRLCSPLLHPPAAPPPPSRRILRPRYFCAPRAGACPSYAREHARHATSFGAPRQVSGD